MDSKRRMLPLASTLPEYTVTELSLALKKVVETGFSRVRVRGEISGLKRSWSVFYTRVLEGQVSQGLYGRLDFTNGYRRK